MKKILNELVRNKKGQALPLVLCFMTLGALVIVPLLHYTHTGLKAGMSQTERTELSYAADAGIEHALWLVNTDNVSLDPYDYETEFAYSLPQDINGKAVTATVKQVWPLSGLESDEYGTTAPSSLSASSGLVNEQEGEYQVQINYDGSEGDLPIDRVAVWLPPGFEYVAGSSSGITTDNPTEVDWKGGKVLTWDFQPPVNFLDLPLPEPPEGGFTPAVEYPASRYLIFNVSPTGKAADSSYAWVRTTNSNLYLAWETGYMINQISSTATDNTTGKSMTVKGYTYVDRVLGEGGFDGGLLTGDYRATGNTLMQDTNSDKKRETFASDSSALVSNIPEDSEVRFAYLYWSGWREWEGEMEADRYVGLKVDGHSVYFNEQGEAVEGTLATDPATEILRPNANGSYCQCEHYGASTNYRCVDEAIADESSTYVRSSGGATLMDTYHIQNRSEATGTINYVTVYARVRATGESAQEAQIVIRTHSTDYYGTNNLLLTADGWANYSDNWTTNPYTGSAWTWSEIQYLQIGVKLDDLGDGYPECTQVYAEVNYTPAFQGVEASKWYLLENEPPDYAYSCFRDVTDLVKLISSDGNATYTVVGVTGSSDSELSYAGWSMIIIYSNPSEEVHQFFLYDHFLYATGGSSHTFDIAGFEAPEDAEAALTCFVGEGDEHYLYDYIAFNDNYLSGGVNPENNVWNGKSSGLGGEPIDGVDIDTFDVSSPIINPGDTSAEIELTTDIDCWNLIYIILGFRSEFIGLIPNDVGIISYSYSGGQ
jgi:hypothetical protein